MTNSHKQIAERKSCVQTRGHLLLYNLLHSCTKLLFGATEWEMPRATCRTAPASQSGCEERDAATIDECFNLKTGV